VIAIGALRHRLVLEAPVETPDGAGGVAREHVAVATLWAAVTPVAARADVVADAAGQTVTHRIVLRAGPEIGTRHRLRHGARLYRVLTCRALDATGRFIVVDAEEQRP
jgi:SPP1 family predicted phage head-tail adaptor